MGLGVHLTPSASWNYVRTLAGFQYSLRSSVFGHGCLVIKVFLQHDKNNEVNVQCTGRVSPHIHTHKRTARGGGGVAHPVTRKGLNQALCCVSDPGTSSWGTMVIRLTELQPCCRGSTGESQFTPVMVRLSRVLFHSHSLCYLLPLLIV